MNKKAVILICSMLFFGTQSFAQEATFAQSPEKIFNSAVSIILSSKYNIEEMNFSRGKAIWTTQTDSYILEVMQENKETKVKIEEINTSTDSTKATINNIFQQLTAQYGTK